MSENEDVYGNLWSCSGGDSLSSPRGSDISSTTLVNEDKSGNIPVSNNNFISENNSITPSAFKCNDDENCAVPSHRTPPSPPHQLTAPLIARMRASAPLRNTTMSVLDEFDPLAAKSDDKDSVPIPPPRSTSMKKSSQDSSSLSPAQHDIDLEPAVPSETDYVSLFQNKLNHVFKDEDFDIPQSPSPSFCESPSIPHDSECTQISSDFDGESIGDIEPSTERIDSASSSSRSGNAGSSSSLNVVSCPPKKEDSRSGELFVYKESSILIKSWQPVWVVITDDEMLIYKKATCRVTKRVIPTTEMVNVKSISNLNDRSRFSLTTRKCDFIFGHPDHNIIAKFSQYIMHAILKCKQDAKTISFAVPIMQGWIKIERISSERYFSLCNEFLSYYESEDDKLFNMPIHKLELKLSNIRMVPRCCNKLEIRMPYRKYLLRFHSDDECSAWFKVLQEAQQASLKGDSADTSSIFSNESNRKCADCGRPNPEWAAINMCITLCTDCSGRHRGLPKTVSKVAGIKLDQHVWTPEILFLMVEIGNGNANAFWEARMPSGTKQGIHDSEEARGTFIHKKYVNKEFCDLSKLTGNDLHEELINATVNNNLMAVMKYVFSGADIQHFSSRYSGSNALQLAKVNHFNALVTFFNQNGALLTQIIQEECPNKYKKREYHSVEISCQLKVKIGSHDSEVRICSIWDSGLKIQPISCGASGGSNEDTIIAIEDMILVEASTSGCKLYVKQSFTNTIIGFPDASEVWIRSLSQCFAPDSQVNLWDPEYNCSGWAVLMYTAFGSWINVWLLLKGYTLYVYEEEAEKISHFDLRKATKVRLCENENIEQYRVFRESCNPLSVSLPDITLYIQAESKAATSAWWEAIDFAFNKVGRTLELQPLTTQNVPVAVDRMLGFLERHDTLQTKGLYRIAGVNSKVTDLTTKLQTRPREVHLREDDWCGSIPEVTDTFKRWFRDLSDPPLTVKLYPEWTAAIKLESKAQRMEQYKKLLKKLPEVNYCTVRQVFIHLGHVVQAFEVTRMDAANLSLLFHPILLHNGSTSAHQFDETARSGIVEMIQEYKFLFDYSRDEEKKEVEMQEAIQKINAASLGPAGHKINPTAPAVSANDLRVDIYLKGGSDGKLVEESVNLHADTTVDDVLKQLEDTGKLTGPKDNLALFEMVLKDLLRPLRGKERVQDVVYRWQEIGKSTDSSSSPSDRFRLEVKYNHVREILAGSVHTTDWSSKIIQAKFADRDAKYSRISLLFQDGCLKLYKKGGESTVNSVMNLLRPGNIGGTYLVSPSSGSGELASFDLTRVYVYHAVQPCRKIPSEYPHGFTFNYIEPPSASPSKTSGLFGKVLAFSSVPDMHWCIQAIHSIQEQLFAASSPTKAIPPLPPRKNPISSKYSIKRK